MKFDLSYLKKVVVKTDQDDSYVIGLTCLHLSLLIAAHRNDNHRSFVRP